MNNTSVVSSNQLDKSMPLWLTVILVSLVAFGVAFIAYITLPLLAPNLCKWDLPPLEKILPNISLGSILLVLISFCLYLLPTGMAGSRNIKNAGILACINILFGWTGVVWLGCLIWALIGERK
jgi:hypothetical protein